MTSFLVKWEIDVEAETPQEAAQKALEIQRDLGSFATVFEVAHPSGWGCVIDLSEETVA